MTTRITEREVLRALAQTCEALDLPCAYDADGVRKPYEEIRAMQWKDDVSAYGGTYGALTLDHQPQYGGARVHSYGADGSFALCRAPGMFTGNNIASGMDKRQPLREIHTTLLRMAADAWRARAEFERDHGGDGFDDDQRAAQVQA